MAQFVNSQKGQRKLVLENCMYVKVRDGQKGKEIWNCDVRSCNSRVHTLNDIIVNRLGEHDHTPTHGRVAVVLARNAMKNVPKKPRKVRGK